MRPPEGWRLDAADNYSPESDRNPAHRFGHAASGVRDAKASGQSS